MRREAEKQQFCITRERHQVPDTGLLDALAQVSLIGVIRILETFPYLDIKNHDEIQNIKRDAKKVLAMSLMAIEVKRFDRGWVVSHDHPMVDSLSLEEMKKAAAEVHHI